ncbi:MAG: hypothetical protein ACXWNW_09100 [Isosphaeraceae bacterium]
MKLAEKLDRLIKEFGWSIAEVTRRIGRDTSQPLLRWMGRAGTGRPKSKTPKLRMDGTPRRDTGSQPDCQDLMALSDLFSVDIRWLIDDSLGWEDRLKADNPILMRIRRLPMDEQIDMWEWHIGRENRDPQSGSTSYPKEQSPPTRPEKKGKPNRGDSKTAAS